MGQFLVKLAKNLVVGFIKKPVAKVVEVGLGSVNRKHVEYYAKVSIRNPYGNPLRISEVSYTLKSDGRVIIAGKIQDAGSLKANETTILKFPLLVPHDIIVSLVKDVGKDLDIDYALELGLTIDLPIIGDITIPLTSSGQIKLPSLKDFF